MTKLRALVLLLGLAAAVLAGGLLPHVHAGGGVGLWNEEHDLGLMATLGAVALPLDAARVVALILVLVMTLAPRADRLAGAPLRLFDSRAPPIR